MYRVFISHSVGPYELGLLYGLIGQSQAQQLQVFIPDRRWNSGAPVPPAVESAIRSSDCVLVLATRYGANTAHVNAELALSTGKPVIVVADAEMMLSANERIHQNRITIDRNSLSNTIDSAVQGIRGLALQASQQETLTWLLVGGLLWLMFTGDNK